jgi:hypothetical protein
MNKRNTDSLTRYNGVGQKQRENVAFLPRPVFLFTQVARRRNIQLVSVNSVTSYDPTNSLHLVLGGNKVRICLFTYKVATFYVLMLHATVFYCKADHAQRQ